MYGPCVLLVVISWVSFWLNREATSDRITLGEDKRRKKMQKKMGKRWRGKSCLFFSRRRGNENEEGSAPRPEPSTGKGKGLEGGGRVYSQSMWRRSEKLDASEDGGGGGVPLTSNYVGPARGIFFRLFRYPVQRIKLGTTTCVLLHFDWKVFASQGGTTPCGLIAF